MNQQHDSSVGIKFMGMSFQLIKAIEMSTIFFSFLFYHMV